MSDKPIDLDAIRKRVDAAMQECPLDRWWDDGNECISTRPLESGAAATFILAAPVDVDALLNAVRDRDAEIARLKARMEMSGDPTQAIMTAAQVQEIRDCEGTRSHSMEWDTCALSLADSHEAMRARLAMATEYSTPDGFTIGIANDTFDCALAGKWMVSRWDDETESPEFLAVDGTWTRYPKEEDAHETDAAAFAVLDAHRAKAPQ